MEIYCIDLFLDEYKKLIKNNSYKDIEQTIIREFINSDIETLKGNAIRLTGNVDRILLKKRMNGSSGYRIYYLILVIDSKVFLAYLHPKTGSMGIPNIGPQFQAKIYEDVVACCKNGNYYRLQEENGKVSFNKEK